MQLPIRILAVLSVLGFAGAAVGQNPPPASLSDATAPIQESTTVATLEITKHLPGPALWKVTRGDAQVIILGGLTPLPHMQTWDTQRIQRALAGADALYLQPRPRLNPFEIIGLAITKGALQLPHGQTLEQVLPPPERAKLLAVTTAIHKKPSDYAHWKPAVAGLMLIADFRKAVGFSEGKPGTTVMHLARDARVPVRYVGDFDLGPYIKTVRTLSPAANLACFDAAMDDIDQEAAHGRAAAAAWATGDLRAVGQTYRVSVLDRCLLQAPNVQALVEHGTDQGVKTIEQALAKPGKSVAVIDLNFLLRQNGILDRLKARGAEISIPD